MELSTTYGVTETNHDTEFETVANSERNVMEQHKDGNVQPSMQHDVNYVGGLDGIEQSLDWIAKGISRLTSDEHNLHLSTGYGTDPVKITLCPDDYDDTMDRLVTAVERIADSLARLAGLSRPRLESWHEQEGYTPRYRKIACDGGAPGPPPTS
jgi:hypothetical protein